MIDPAAQRILALLPCRNEEPSIGPTLRAVADVLPGTDCLVIDDESGDGTARAAREAGARVLSLTVNLGYGAALETGYQFAVENGYDIVLQLDGDGQHPPAELPKLLRPLLAGEADIVLGSRYLKAGDAFPTSVGRRLGQRLFAAIVNITTRRHFTDPTSGFQALNREAFGLFGRGGIFPSDYPDADILLTAHLAGLRILEVPVRMLPRLRGSSMHSTLSSGYYVIKMMFSLFIVFLNREKFRLARRRAMS